ncbi:MAG: LptF/LptG family permease, partial [bacterium]
VIEKKVPFAIFMKILLYMLPSFSVLAFPLATLFAALLSVGRLSRDGEIDVMRTGGISVMRILAPFIVIGILVSAADFYLIQEVVPRANRRSAQIWAQFLLSDVTGKPMSDVFFKGTGGRFFYIGDINTKTHTVHRVIIFETQTNKTYPRMITAPTGVWSEKTLNLTDGAIHQFSNDGHLEYEANFKTLEMDLQRQMEEIMGEQKSPQEMSIQELKERITLFKKSGINTDSYETDLHFKMSIPAASLICILLGVPLSIRTGRSGMMVGFVTTISLVALYYVLWIIDTALGRQGVLPPFAAAWLQNILFLFVGIFLIIRTRK